MNENNQTQYLDILLHYVIEHPEALDQVYFLKSIVKDFDFAIFYYIEHFKQESAKLTRPNLCAALSSSKLDWVDDKSIFTKRLGGPKVSKVLLKQLTTKSVSTQVEYADLFERGLLKRYDDIMLAQLPTEAEFKTLCKNAQHTGTILFAKEIVNDLANILSGTSSYTVLNHVKYERTDCLNYIMDKVSGFLQSIQPDEIATYKETVQRSFAVAPNSLYPAYVINMGKAIFTNPQPGFVISIIAAEKLGKTRYTVGEHVFPVIMQGKNVLYLSGEMTQDQIRCMLLVKYLYVKKSFAISEKDCLDILMVVNKIQLGTATQEDRDYYDKVPTKFKEAVIVGQHELFFSGKYGKLIVRHISDDVGPTGISRYFVLEDYFPLIRAELQNMNPKERYALIVRDHVNHMTSSTGLKPVEYVTKYLQLAKTLATDKEHPLVYIIINHFNTDIADLIAKQGNIDGIKLRGHNSNEEGKSCDIQIALYERPNQARDGLMTLVVVNDRRKRVEEIFKTKEFVVEARRGFCEFKYFGCTKMPYPETKEEVEKLIQVLAERE